MTTGLSWTAAECQDRQRPCRAHLKLEEEALQGSAQVLREADIAFQRVAVDGVRVERSVHACMQRVPRQLAALPPNLA